jgi:hypothetical protein
MPKDESCVPDECVKVAELQCDVELVCQAAQVRSRLHDPQATRAQGVGDCLGPCKGPCRSAWRVEPLQAGRDTHWHDVLEMVHKVYCLFKLEALPVRIPTGHHLSHTAYLARKRQTAICHVRCVFRLKPFEARLACQAGIGIMCFDITQKSC